MIEIQNTHPDYWRLKYCLRLFPNHPRKIDYQNYLYSDGDKIIMTDGYCLHIADVQSGFLDPGKYKLMSKTKSKSLILQNFGDDFPETIAHHKFKPGAYIIDTSKSFSIDACHLCKMLPSGCEVQIEFLRKSWIDNVYLEWYAHEVKVNSMPQPIFMKCEELKVESLIMPMYNRGRRI